MQQSAAPTDPVRGLGEAEAQARLASDGANELQRANVRTPLRIVLEVVREPMLALLLGAGTVYFLLGEPQDAIILLTFALLSIAITVVQETRTERVLDALRDLTSPRALVIRDGERKHVAGRDVVRGDLIVLEEGDRVPADAVILSCHDLQTDESLLTGESVPVRKVTLPADAASRHGRPGGDDLPFVFSGTLVVRGTGIAEVTATGALSEIGKIGQSLNALETEQPRLQIQTRKLVFGFAMVGGAVSVLVVLLYGLLRQGWLDALLAGIAVGMSMLPEELPVVLTIFMAMGAWRISQARVLTRRAAAIETMGSATVLCTDKTGTLTQNRMSIAQMRLRGGQALQLDAPPSGELPDVFEALAQFGLLASATEPFDPMDKAFHVVARSQMPKLDVASTTGKVVRAYGLRPDLLAMAQVWRKAPDSEDAIVAAKGAPEAIAQLCKLGESDRQAVTHQVEAMAAKGLRVLGVARASFRGKTLPETQGEFAFEFLGLVGLADPLRPTVKSAVADCQAAGIRVVMITGDYPATARAIGMQAGLASEDVASGEELQALSDENLATRVRTTNIFARIMPEQKLRIVNALKRNGEIVAMTGDGVNDAPSLKAAHIGIAMGGRGTDVAREASSIVLLDDDFGSIVKAIGLGRRIYDNLRKAMGFIFAVHVPIAGLALLPLLTGLPILFSPVHIAFLELIIDPVCSLVFEAEAAEDNAMRRKPRSPDELLFSRPLIVWSLLQGLLAFALVAGIYMVGLWRGMPAEEVRALAFFSLVLTLVALIFVNRSFSSSLLTAVSRPNQALRWVLIAIPTMLALTLAVPFARKLFHFGPLHLNDLAVVLGAGVVLLVALETIKHLLSHRLTQPNA